MPFDAHGFNDPLPHNLEVEQAILGILLIDNRKVDDAADALCAEDFYAPAHIRIFSTICEVVARGQTASPVTLKNHFAGDKDLESVGGSIYLADLAGAVFSAINLTDYMRTLKDLSTRRALIVAACGLNRAARDCDLNKSAEKVLEGAEAELFRISEVREGGDAPVSLSAALHDTIAQIEAVQSGRATGLMTGIAELDFITNGFWPSDLVIVAARPSMGKTAFALSIAHNAAQAGASVLFYSLEMSKVQLVQRLLARYTSLATGMQNRQGAFKREHFDKLFEAQQKMANLKIAIDDRAGLSVHQIRARARRHKRRVGLDLIVIDQLSLIEMERGYSNKVDQIGEVTRALKVLAKDLGVPIILLHQLNREVEKREDKRPMLADLRDSGNVEQDADSVIFLYREEYYLEKNPPSQRQNEGDEKYTERKNRHHVALERSRGWADVIVAKIRQGQCGDARLRFNGARQVFFSQSEGEF